VKTRQAQHLCSEGKVEGAVRFGRSWLIPKDALKPLDRRRKENHGYIKVDGAEVDRIIGSVNGTMAIEGMPLTDDDKSRLREILRGEATAEDMVRRLVAKHKRAVDA
jgi:hypothetical protein